MVGRHRQQDQRQSFGGEVVPHPGPGRLAQRHDGMRSVLHQRIDLVANRGGGEPSELLPLPRWMLGQVYEMAEMEQLAQLCHLLVLLAIPQLLEEIVDAHQQPARFRGGEDHAPGRNVIERAADLIDRQQVGGRALGDDDDPDLLGTGDNYPSPLLLRRCCFHRIAMASMLEHKSLCEASAITR